MFLPRWALACVMCNQHVACRVTKYFLHISVLRNVDARGVPGLPWPMNSQKLCDWADDIRIDPNDPEYSDITELIMVSFRSCQHYKYILFPHMYLIHSSIICCAFFWTLSVHVKVELRVCMILSQFRVLERR